MPENCFVSGCIRRGSTARGHKGTPQKGSRHAAETSHHVVMPHTQHPTVFLPAGVAMLLHTASPLFASALHVLGHVRDGKCYSRECHHWPWLSGILPREVARRRLLGGFRTSAKSRATPTTCQSVRNVPSQSVGKTRASQMPEIFKAAKLIRRRPSMDTASASHSKAP